MLYKLLQHVRHRDDAMQYKMQYCNLQVQDANWCLVVTTASV